MNPHSGFQPVSFGDTVNFLNSRERMNMSDRQMASFSFVGVCFDDGVQLVLAGR